MEHRQPSLLQLLVPNSAAALGLHDKRNQDDSSFSVASAAAAAEGTVSALSTATKAAAPSVVYTPSTVSIPHSDGVTAAPTAMDSDDISSPFPDNGSTLAALSNLFSQAVFQPQQAGGDERGLEEEEEGRPSDAPTASSRTTFSLVSRMHSTILPQTAIDAAAAAAAAPTAHNADQSQASSFTDATNTAAVAAQSAVCAAPRGPMEAMASITTAHSGSNSHAAAARDQCRSSGINVSIPSDIDWEQEPQPEESPPSRPPSRARRATLAGPADFPEISELGAQAKGNHADGSQADPAALSPLTNDGMNVPLLQVEDDVPANEYMSNLFVSFDLNLSAAGFYSPPRVLSTTGLAVPSSLTSSVSPSAASHRKQMSVEMRSTTMAPVANACNSTSSAPSQSAEGGTGEMRRFSQAFALQSSASDGGQQRLSQMISLPQERPTDSSTAASHHSTEVPTPRSSAEHSSAVLGAFAASTEDTLLAAAAPADAEGNDEALAATVAGAATDSENAMHGKPAIASSRPAAGAPVDDNNSSASASPFPSLSLNERSSTQRQASSPLASRRSDLTKATDNVAASTSAPSPTEPKGSEKGGDLGSGANESMEDHENDNSLFSTNAANNSGSASSNACAVSLAAPHSESLHAHGGPTNSGSLPLPLATTDNGNANHQNSTSHSTVSVFSFSQDAVAWPSDGLSSSQLREDSAVSQNVTRHSALHWIQRSFFVPLGRMTSSVGSFFVRRVRQGRWLMFGLFNIPKAMLFSPIRRMLSKQTEEDTMQRSGNASSRGMRKKPHLTVKLQLEPRDASPSPSSSTCDAFSEAAGVGSVSFSETIPLSLPPSQGASPATNGPASWRRGLTSTQVSEGLQQTLRETWNGAANAWFGTAAQREPRTALRSSNRIRRSAASEQSQSSPQLQPSSGASGGGGGGEDLLWYAQHNGSPSSLRLSFSDSLSPGYEGLSASGVFNRGTPLSISRQLAALGNSGSLPAGSPFVEYSASPKRKRNSLSGIAASTNSALLDDEYRAQLYHEFQHPPSCIIGDLTGCYVAYKAMSETSSNGHHVLNWKELSLLLQPEDYIDYRDLFPPYHFLTFPDFVEFVEVLSVRHRR
ncbi:hypothetical protein ABB37_03789 [Leptomonas pyrrhocoris]|uniref:Uncharacterized protein n=1 Tax=Leptomonas pyrrhocoris TaxID=157538 RepID=A0A0M9G3I5_LEPPY|nr:hypothetical protein ABB37_03789 [Leptomonas pyrrhocoris]KPA81419.1 hypothetical protein ABB37_03789 [Leptomonas pyrrhocoris]|eukprot:XP_015659858.1 hypothetical protein ABB37_03789 [Leptomonas pyrrhocoris]